MSDVPQQFSKGPTTLDFTGVTVLGLPGGAGIVSINGDATPAQGLSAQSPGFVSNNGVGGHVVVYQDFVPAVPGPSAAGLVPNPGAAGPTDYLAADATFKPLPAPFPGGIVSINADATAAQTLAVSGGLALFEVPGAHAISGVPFAPAAPGPSAQGMVPDPGLAGPTDYLAADATFKPIPAGLSGLTSGNVPVATGANSLADSASLKALAAGLDVKDLANPQTVRIFGTTDATDTNFEALSIGFDGSVFLIQNVEGGAGSARQLRLQSDSGIQLNNSGFDVLSINGSSISPSSDGSTDLGATGKGFGHFNLSISADKSAGVTTLVGGTQVVANVSVTANSLIFVSMQTPGGVPGFLSIVLNPGVGFTINSTSGADTSIVAYLIIN